jgi:hypothetical protein
MFLDPVFRRIDQLPRLVRAPLLGGSLGVVMNLFALLGGDYRPPLSAVPGPVGVVILKAFALGAIFGLAVSFIALPLMARRDRWSW